VEWPSGDSCCCVFDTTCPHEGTRARPPTLPIPRNRGPPPSSLAGDSCSPARRCGIACGMPLSDSMTRRRSGHAKGSRDPRDSSGVPGRLPFDDGSWTEGSMPKDHDPQFPTDPSICLRECERIEARRAETTKEARFTRAVPKASPNIASWPAQKIKGSSPKIFWELRPPGGMPTHVQAQALGPRTHASC